MSAAGLCWPAEVLDGVDEVQFLAPAELDELLGLPDSVRVIAAGLDLDFRGAPFPAVELLATHTASITRLTGVCARCGAAATRSQRLLDGRPAASNTPTIVLGRQGLYEPRCAACHEVS